MLEDQMIQDKKEKQPLVANRHRCHGERLHLLATLDASQTMPGIQIIFGSNKITRGNKGNPPVEKRSVYCSVNKHMGG